MLFSLFLGMQVETIKAIDSEDEAIGRVIKSPLRARLDKMEVLKGQHVKIGDILCVLECMKMKIRMFSPFEGRVEHIFFKEAENIDFQSPIISFATYVADFNFPSQVFQIASNKNDKMSLCSFVVSKYIVQPLNPMAARLIIDKWLPVQGKAEVLQKQILNSEDSLLLISYSHYFGSFLVRNLLFRFSEINNTDTIFLKKISHHQIVNRKKVHEHNHIVKSSSHKKFKVIEGVLIQDLRFPMKSITDIRFWEIIGLTVLVGLALALRWYKTFICYILSIRKKSFLEIVNLKSFIYLEKPIANNRNKIIQVNSKLA